MEHLKLMGLSLVLLITLNGISNAQVKNVAPVNMQSNAIVESATIDGITVFTGTAANFLVPATFTESVTASVVFIPDTNGMVFKSNINNEIGRLNTNQFLFLIPISTSGIISASDTINGASSQSVSGLGTFGSLQSNSNVQGLDARFTGTGSSYGINIGNDTQIYDDGTNILRTPDSLTVDSSIDVGESSTTASQIKRNSIVNNTPILLIKNGNDDTVAWFGGLGGINFYSKTLSSASLLFSVSNSADYIMQAWGNANIVLGVTSPQVTGVTIKDNLHVGGTVSTPSNLDFKENVMFQPDVPETTGMKTILFNWKRKIPDKALNDFEDIIEPIESVTTDDKGNSVTEIVGQKVVATAEDQYEKYQMELQADIINAGRERYGVDIDDPSVPEAIKIRTIYGRDEIGHAEAIGYLLNKVKELEERISVLENK